MGPIYANGSSHAVNKQAQVSRLKLLTNHSLHLHIRNWAKSWPRKSSKLSEDILLDGSSVKVCIYYDEADLRLLRCGSYSYTSLDRSEMRYQEDSQDTLLSGYPRDPPSPKAAPPSYSPAIRDHRDGIAHLARDGIMLGRGTLRLPGRTRANVRRRDQETIR